MIRALEGVALLVALVVVLAALGREWPRLRRWLTVAAVLGALVVVPGLIPAVTS